MRNALFLLIIALYVVGCKKDNATTPEVKKIDTVAGKIVPAFNDQWGSAKDTAPIVEINGVINRSSRDKSYMLEQDGKMVVVLGRLQNNASLVITFPYGRKVLKKDEQYAIPEIGGEVMFGVADLSPENPYHFASTKWGGTARIKITEMDNDTLEARFYGTIKSFEKVEKPIVIKNGFFRIGWNDNVEI